MTALAPGPIIPGFSPDPSVCLIGDTYFLVNSSFHVFPGIPIYTSRDLKSWKHFGHAIHRRSQLSLFHATTTLHPGDDGNTILATGGLYAPTIRHHNGVTYIFCTNLVHSSPTTPSDERNFFITTADIWSGQWSDPIYYGFRGIDPSVLFDDDGKIYMQGTSNDFVIYNMEIDMKTGAYTTEPRVIWHGWSRKYTEGPHVYKRNGWYYLLCAEGGTFNYHMVSMARSRSIWGPYESCPTNPVWTACGTDNLAQHTGHADLFQDAQKNWWAVMLGVRLINGRYALGRESFLTRVEWPEENDWPLIKPVMADSEHEPRPLPVSCDHDGVDWLYLRDPDMSRFSASPDGGMRIRASAIDLSSPRDTVSFIGKRQRRLAGTAVVTLNLHLSVTTGSAAKDVPLRAGLTVYKDELRFLELSYDFNHQRVRFHGENAVRKYNETVENAPPADADKIVFRIRYTSQTYDFSFRSTLPGSDWTVISEVDALQLTGFDFTGPLIGMFAVGHDDVIMDFENFLIDNIEARKDIV